MARIKVEGTADFVRAVRRMSSKVLDDLSPAMRDEAATVLAASDVLVPVGESGKLKASGFVDGALINPRKKSVSATAGYEHPQAGPIHEGVHYGLQLTAPRFLKKAMKSARKRFAQRVATAARSSISRHAKR